MRRKKLLAKLEWLAEHSEKHDQSFWTNIHGYYNEKGDWVNWKLKEEDDQIINCGTKGCLAGWIGLLDAPVGTKFYESDLTLPGTDDGSKIMSYHTYASIAMDLTFAEAGYLFSDDTNRASQELFVNMRKDERRAFLKRERIWSKREIRTKVTLENYNEF